MQLPRSSRAAYDLLCLFAWLAPDRIPRKELLEAGSLSGAFADRDQWAEVVGTLGQYSLLKREWADGVVTAYSLHRLVQHVVRDRLAVDGKDAQWLEAACDLVDAAFPLQLGKLHHWTERSTPAAC